jgi:hypothetical protein
MKLAKWLRDLTSYTDPAWLLRDELPDSLSLPD